MEEISTDLLQKNFESAKSLDEYLSNDNVLRADLGFYLEERMAEHNLTVPELARRVDVSASHIYDILDPDTTAGISRDTLIKLAFAIPLSLTECNRALKLAEHSELYAKVRRDAIIAFCLREGKSLYDTNQELRKRGEQQIEDKLSAN